MPKIAVQPFMLTNVLLKISTTGGVPAEVGDYEAHVSQVQFDPNTPSATWKGLSAGSSHTGVGTPTWNCTLGVAQDWATPNALSRYLHEHVGEEIDVTFEPVAGGTPIDARLVIVPGSIGGTGEAFATSAPVLPVQGQPTLGAAA